MISCWYGVGFLVWTIDCSFVAYDGIMIGLMGTMYVCMHVCSSVIMGMGDFAIPSWFIQEVCSFWGIAGDFVGDLCCMTGIYYFGEHWARALVPMSP